MGDDYRVHDHTGVSSSFRSLDNARAYVAWLQAREKIPARLERVEDSAVWDEVEKKWT